MADNGFNETSCRTSYQVALKWKRKVDRSYAISLGNKLLDRHNIMALRVPNCFVGNYDKEKYGFYICPEIGDAYKLVYQAGKRNLVEIVHIDPVKP